jgi:hypothetical protein
MMDSDNQLSRAFEMVSIVQLARDLGIDLREGAGQKSPFRDDKRAGSFQVGPSWFKDYAFEEHSGGHIKFVMLAKPGWTKKEAIEFIIRAAGMEPTKQSAGKVKAVVKEKREKLFSKALEKAAEIPKLDIPEPGPWPPWVEERWAEGQSIRKDPMDELAAYAKQGETRGWPREVMIELLNLNKTSSPKVPWDKGRCWAWIVEKPIFQGHKAALVKVGFHGRYKVYNAAGDEKRWVYVPYVPSTSTNGPPKKYTDFQQRLVKYNTRLPAYPFVLGDLNAPRLVIITEGQAVFVLRGVSSRMVFMAAYGAWLRRHKPFVWVIGDNDEAGRKLIERRHDEKITADPSFIDRLRAQGCKVAGRYYNVEGCKDFNDVWREHKPSRKQMIKLAVEAGCGDLVNG